MRALALLSLLTVVGVSPAALAGTPLDRFDADASQITLNGVVEVPLLSLSNADLARPGRYIEVTVGEDAVGLFRLEPGHSQVRVSESFAKEAGAKVKSRNKRAFNLMGEDGRFGYGGEVKTANLDKLAIGGAVFEGVSAVVTDLGSGLSVDGELGLGAFDGAVAWAILQSKGVVRVGLSSAGAEVTGAVDGAALPSHAVASTKVKAKIGHIKDVTYHPGAPFVVAAAIGGQQADVQLGNDDLWAGGDGALVPADAPRFEASGTERAWVEVALVPDAAVSVLYRVDPGYGLALTEPPAWRATLGQHVLGAYDLAFDPANGVVKAHPLAPGERSAAASAADAALARLEADTKEAPDEDEEGEKDEKDEKDDDKPDTKPIIAYAKALEGYGRTSDALALREQVAELEPRDCSAWQSLGRTRVALGDLTGATDAFKKSSELYHGWWDLELDEREKLAKKLGKLEEEEAEQAEHKVQPSSCFAVDGDLAATYLAAGDYDAVEKLYRTRLDLDPSVAIAFGGARLAAGDNEGAHEPLRQALKLEGIGTPSADVRMGLGIANARAGNAVAALPQLEGAVESGDTAAQFDDLALYYEVLRADKGNAAAAAAARARAAARPGDPAEVFAAAQVLSKAGDPTAALNLATAAATLIDDPLQARYQPRDAALRARIFVFLGQLDLAHTAADVAKAADPALPATWLAYAEIAAAEGDAAKAAEYRRRAGQLGATNPTYAILLSGK